MPEDKKDILEFPLEDVSIPQAIVLMMQAATTTVSLLPDYAGDGELETDNDRLQLLAEKLEARVEDEINKGARTDAVPEDNPNEPVFTDIEGHQVSLKHEWVEYAKENLITQVLVDNIVFVLTCNERVFADPVLGTTSRCIKRFGHDSLEHEDMEGNVR